MEIYLIRHGESVANRDRIIQGNLDAPLTDLGKKQARKLANVLPDEFNKIYSSPLVRAKNTCQLALQIDDIANGVHLHDDLREISFGNLEGKIWDELEIDLDDLKKFTHFETDPFNGDHDIEPLDTFFSRSHRVFNEIIKNARDNNDSKIAIFAHGGILKSILDCHLNLTDQTHFKNTEIVKLERNGKNWTMISMTDHIVEDS